MMGSLLQDWKIITFTNDGKMTDRLKAKVGFRTISGTYRLDGNALHINRDTGPVAKDERVTMCYVRELTEDALVLMAPIEIDGVQSAYKRVVEKKPQDK